MTAKRFCPSCQAVLTLSDDDAPSACPCCGGTWLPTMAAAAYDSLDFDVVTGEPLECFGFEPECPSCSSRLSRRLLRAVGEVGACGGCGGLWVGPGRLERLKAVAAGLERQPTMLDERGSPFVWRTVMMLSALSAAAAWVLSARVL